MITQRLFAEEQRIRNVLSQQRDAVLYEQERYHEYLHKPEASLKTADKWKKRISAYIEASNLMSDYLTDYTLKLHGVLKYVRQAEEEVKVAKTTLLYMDQLHEHQAARNAVDKLEQLLYKLLGDQIELLEPQLRAEWSKHIDAELAIYQQMVAERRGASHA